uniref:Hematopoietic cell signal transducer n=1 Tax=Chinchilla lanigera TaxID=34839 RepID=A0A8C2YTU9_CHILA
MALAGLLLFLLSGSCSGCGPLSQQLPAGLVAAAAVRSLLVVGVVSTCARPSLRRSPSPPDEDSSVYINMPHRG